MRLYPVVLCAIALGGSIEAAAQPAPTATEIFELRSKCQKLGDQKLEDSFAGSYWSQTVTTNYDIVNHHCYIKLELSPADLSLPLEKRKTQTYLFDGQTGEMLASFRTEGTDRRSGIVNDQYWEGGSIGFDAAANYINKMMATKR